MVDTTAFPDRTISIDCDVLQADGGTRTASITGGYVALTRAFERCVALGVLKAVPLVEPAVEHAVGLVAVAREPLSPLVAALFAAAKKMMAG